MRRNLKVLGLTLGAIFAMSALSAASASAEETQTQHFHADQEKVILTGATEAATGGSTLEIPGGPNIVCAKGTYEGTVQGTKSEDGKYTATQVTVHPVYDECEIPGLGKSTANTNGCDYVLTAHTMESTPEEEHATTEVECTAGSQITISGPGCKVKIGTEGKGTIPEETLKNGVRYENKETEGKKTITVTATVENVPFESEGALCGLAGIPKKSHNSSYTDHVTVEGKEDLTQNSTTHKLEGCVEGKQVDIWWE